MSISISCPQCGKKYNAPDHLSGKLLRCKQCQAAIKVPKIVVAAVPTPVSYPVLVPAHDAAAPPNADLPAPMILMDAPPAEPAHPTAMPYAEPSVLSPAAPAMFDRASLLVMGGGLVTSVLALFLNYAIELASGGDFNPMSWYLWLIIPVGAILVGAAAGSGYGTVAWYRGVRLTKVTLATIIALQVLFYGAAQYYTFCYVQAQHPNLHNVGFWEYYNYATTHMTYTTYGNGPVNKPIQLGSFGYALRLIELIGFACGGIWVPFVMFKKAYCEPCANYMRTKQLTVIPAGGNARAYAKAVKKGTADTMLSPDEVAANAQQTLAQLRQLGTAGDLQGFRSVLAAHPKPNNFQAAKMPVRIVVSLCYCPKCNAGHLAASHVSVVGRKVTRRSLGNTELHPDFVAAGRPA